MLTATSGLVLVRPHWAGQTRDLLAILINSTSAAEANIALSLLREDLSEKVLVNAINLRETLACLPASPFSMSVDEQTFVRAAGMKKDRAVLLKELGDGIELAVTTAGNYVLDVIVRIDGKTHYWSPIRVTTEYVCADLIDHVISSDHLLQGAIDLVMAMGLVFNPTFYLSIEDWNLEHAQEAVQGISDLF